MNLRPYPILVIYFLWACLPPISGWAQNLTLVEGQSPVPGEISLPLVSYRKESAQKTQIFGDKVTI